MSANRLGAYVFLLVLLGATPHRGVAEERVAAPRIIDGISTVASEFPTVGELGDTTGYYCTGTLISPRHVLTAAHCVTDHNGVKNVDDTGGRFRLGGQTYSTVKIDVHPTYTGELESEDQLDLAVLTLAQDVPNVTPTLLFRQVPVVGTLLTIAGFGLIGTGSSGVDSNSPSPTPGTIHYGTTPIDTVTATFIKWNFENKPAPNKESNTAPGDSGGPAFITVNDERLLAGVTSGGSRVDAGFGDLSFDTRVDIAAAWIDSIVNAEPPPPPPPQADLLISSAAFLTPPLVSGIPCSLRITLQNSGDADAPAFSVSVYLNASSPPNSSAGAFETRSVAGLGAGASSQIDFTVAYPSGGEFNLALFADSQLTVDESSEANNFFYEPVSVLAQGVDLQISSIAKTEATPGVEAHFEVTVINAGATASSGFQVAFYASIFATPGAVEAPTQLLPVNALSPGGAVTVAFELPIQNTPRAGRAYFTADYTQQVTELSETNNAASSDWGIANTPPSIASAIAFSTKVASIGEIVEFSIALSDAEGDPLGVFWDFGDGTFATGPVVTHAFTSAGSYSVTVTYTDGPFHTQSILSLIEIDKEIIDLGAVHLLVKRGRFKLTVPRPAVFQAREPVKSYLVAGFPGEKSRYRNFKLNGTAISKGQFTFTIEFFARKTGNTARLRYRYTVID